MLTNSISNISTARLTHTRARSKRSPGIVEEVMDDEDHAYRLPDSTDGNNYIFILLFIHCSDY